MTNNKQKGHLTTFDDGTVIFVPYVSTGKSRYESLLNLPQVSLRLTQKNYQVVIDAPRKLGYLKAFESMVSSMNQVGNYMAEQHINTVIDGNDRTQD